jgi:hypothetical protein
MSDVMEDSELPARGVQLELNNFEGPLNVLLELARCQAVDIAVISVIDLETMQICGVCSVFGRSCAHGTRGSWWRS